jgi:glycosyltransferase involved in cell wall biosynthesis
MRLLIVSNMSHYLREGRVVGWGPTVREIDRLAKLFEEVRHIGCLYSDPAPPSALPYESERVTLVPIPPSGGKTLRHKLGIVRLTPLYLRTILREMRHADVLHIRCPANIPMIACLVSAFRQTPGVRWIKYAGNWRPAGSEPWSYTFQRWWLNRGLHRGVVTVNGEWPGQPSHVHSFLNPCLTAEELAEGLIAAEGKRFNQPIRLLFVGRVESAKGAGRAVEILNGLRGAGINACLDLIGDGPERTEFERLVSGLRLSSLTKFHGWLPRTSLRPLLARAHLALLPTSCSEGWPKALSEAMAYGAVPICGAVSSIPQILAQAGGGWCGDAYDITGFVNAIRTYWNDPNRWYAESRKCRAFAEQFTYDLYLQAVRRLLRLGPQVIELPGLPRESATSRTV